MSRVEYITVSSGGRGFWRRLASGEIQIMRLYDCTWAPTDSDWGRLREDRGRQRVVGLYVRLRAGTT